MSATIPRVLSVAASDSSGAAGMQADLKTFEARGVYGMSALTGITAQNSLGVQTIQLLPVELVAAQIDSVLTDIGADVLKTGLLLSAPVIRLVSQKAAEYQIANLVVDPVMVAGDGRRLIDAEAERAYLDVLFPRALIVTPNLDEAALLTGRSVQSPTDMYIAAETIYQLGQHGEHGQRGERGPRFVLIKGGHVPDGDDVVDVLYDGEHMHEFRAPRLPVNNPRGTGCTFASAIAAELAKGHTVYDAVAIAKDYVGAALRGALGWHLGSGRGTVFHGVRGG